MTIHKILNQALAQKKAALIPYITAGDPDLDTSREILHALSAGGADLIEVGVPFSDPIADGPTLQAAAERALAQHTHLAGIFAMVKQARQEGLTTPLILFSYLNPLYRKYPQASLEKVFSEAREAGFNGLLLVDVPLEAAQEPFAAARRAGLETIALCAPTTSIQRQAVLNALTPDAVYAIARLGITGARQQLDADLIPRLQHLQHQLCAPVMVGFGVSTPEQVAQLRPHVGGIVCGSALVQVIAEAPPAQKAERAYAFMQSLKGEREASSPVLRPAL
jgi:tryptophan synthase alpha chain